MAHRVHDHNQPNQLFRAPIPENATDILDVGCGEGSWPIDVADQFPNSNAHTSAETLRFTDTVPVTVHGVDLYPPPQTWVPPNCILEVDDAAKPWTFTQKFDLIHLRWMLGSFSEAGWSEFYEQAYRYASRRFQVLTTLTHLGI